MPKGHEGFTAGREGMIHVLGRMEGDIKRFHHTIQILHNLKLRCCLFLEFSI